MHQCLAWAISSQINENWFENQLTGNVTLVISITKYKKNVHQQLTVNIAEKRKTNACFSFPVKGCS